MPCRDRGAISMRRRELITLLAITAVAWPRAARAQQPRVPVIGYLTTGSPDDSTSDQAAAFARGLAEMGYVVGNNVTIERRWAREKYDRLPELAKELVRLNPALIVVGGNVAALAASRATSTIPIVFNIASDPVKLGLAKSFAHPGGNATGISLMTATLTLKRLELIGELIPHNSTVGFLVNPDNQDILQEIKDVARSTGRSMESPWRATLMTSNKHLHSLPRLESALYSSPTMRFSEPTFATCRIGKASFAAGVVRMARVSGGWRINELRAEPPRNLSKSRKLRRP